MSSLDYLELCRLCLVKERVSVPIFEGEGDVRQIFLKIAACLPVKVNREDKLPKKICDDCVYKVELFYQFWNTTANAEKQLLQWLGEVNLEDKQGYVTNVVNPIGMKPDQNTKNRLDGSVMQQIDEQQNNMGIGMMENMGLGLPMMMPNANQQQITSVPMDSSGNSVQTVQAVPGPSTQTAHNQIQQNQTSTTQQEEEEEESEEDENSDDECDGDEGLPVKEEGEEDPNRTIEPTTFVNVSLACDEAGPSGLQQQKIPELPEMAIPQTPDGDPKSGSRTTKKTAVHAVRKRVLVGSLRNTTPVGTKKRRQLDTEKENQLSNLEENAPQNEQRNVEIKQEEIHIKHEILPDTEANTATTTISCEQCGKIFSTRRSYIKHKGSVHVPSIYECDVCKLKFKQMAAVRKHKIKVHREVPSQNQMRPLSNIVNCDQCGKIFTTRRSYQKHKAVHAPKIYECDICMQKFKKKYIVAKHKKAVHGESDPYICHYCDFKTHHRSYLNIHITRKHTDTFQFPCEKCDRKFRVKADYQKHMITHDGIPCICDICGVSLPNKMSLYFHKHYNHRTRENSFPCPLCKRKLQSKKNLELHMEQHERRYVCDECGLTLTRKCALKKHIRTHSGEKPHACDVCGRSFASASGRKVHMLTHSGIRPYICTICGYSFTQRPALSVHWKKKHADVSVPPPAAVPIKSIIDSMTRRCAKVKSE